MTAESLIGRVLVFYPPQAVVLGLAKAKSSLVGVVEAARSINPTERGQIPDFECTVKGRSGKVAVISFVESYATPFDTWAEALASQS